MAWAYGAGAAAFALIAGWLGGAALWLAWPALSLALVSAGYLRIGADVFQKSADGRLSLAARWLLAPYLAAAWVNSRWWTRRAPTPVLVADGVWLGRMPSARDARRFAGIVDLSAELALPASAQASRQTVPVLDLTVPAAPELAAAAGHIDALRARGPVLVCCALGLSRSACAVAAWLVTTGRDASIDAAFARLRSTRPGVVLGTGHAAAIAAAQRHQP